MLSPAIFGSVSTVDFLRDHPQKKTVTRLCHFRDLENSSYRQRNYYYCNFAHFIPRKKRGRRGPKVLLKIEICQLSCNMTLFHFIQCLSSDSFHPLYLAWQHNCLTLPFLPSPQAGVCLLTVSTLSLWAAFWTTNTGTTSQWRTTAITSTSPWTKAHCGYRFHLNSPTGITIRWGVCDEHGHILHIHTVTLQMFYVFFFLMCFLSRWAWAHTKASTLRGHSDQIEIFTAVWKTLFTTAWTWWTLLNIETRGLLWRYTGSPCASEKFMFMFQYHSVEILSYN